MDLKTFIFVWFLKFDSASHRSISKLLKWLGWDVGNCCSSTFYLVYKVGPEKFWQSSTFLIRRIFAVGVPVVQCRVY